jgi:hypothetical protein
MDLKGKGSLAYMVSPSELALSTRDSLCLPPRSGPSEKAKKELDCNLPEQPRCDSGQKWSGGWVSGFSGMGISQGTLTSSLPLTTDYQT